MIITIRKQVQFGYRQMCDSICTISGKKSKNMTIYYG